MPTGSAGIENRPFGPVMAVRTIPEAELVTVMVTAGTTACDSSRTSPVRSAAVARV